MSEITKAKQQDGFPIPDIYWAVFAVFVVAFYFFGLNIPLLGPDEPRYAQVAREMFERGDLISPTLGGFNWFEKPALLYWFQIASYYIFGVTEFAARFGSAIAGLGTVFALMILGRHESKNHGTDMHLGRWIGLIAASTVGVIAFSRGASFDIMITFPLTAAMVSFYCYDQALSDSFRSKYIPLISFYVFIGLALLAKGLIGIIFPFAIVGFYYVLSRRLPKLDLLFSILWGTTLAVLIASIWYLPMYMRHGYEFIDEFFIQHHFQRFTSNKYKHPQPFYFFLWVLPLMTIPWLPLFFAAVFKRIKQAIVSPSSAARSAALPPLVLFSFAWLLVPLVFFSFSGSKLPGYILPAVPAAIVLTGLYVFDLVGKSRRWRNAVVATAIGTLLVSFALLVAVVPKFADADSVRTLIDAASSRGYVSNRVVNMHTVSHNAEFYAAGRIVREPDGKLLRATGATELAAEIEKNDGQPILVLVPLEYLDQLLREDRLKSEVLKDNGELAIAVVSPR